MTSPRKREARLAVAGLAPANPADAEEIAHVFVDARMGMNYLPESPYSGEETIAFLHGLIEDPDNLVLKADLEDGCICGFGVFGEGRMDHLYVQPGFQGRGIGTMLLRAAQERFGHLEGWVFEKNIEAIRFYERNGFRVIEHTDGSRNEEGEPDVRIAWSADDSGRSGSANGAPALAFPEHLSDEVVALRPWGEADLPGLEAASSDETITRITAVPVPYSREAGLRFIEERHRAAEEGSAMSGAIHDTATGTMLGGINLTRFDWENESAVGGYWVIPSGRGRGAAGRALALLSEWAFRDLGLRQIELHIEPENDASIAVAAAAGFRPDGTVRDKPLGKDLELDMLRFVIDAHTSGSAAS